MLKISTTIVGFTIALAGCANVTPKGLDAPVAINSKPSEAVSLKAEGASAPSIMVSFDDNPELALIMAEALRNRGFNIVSAADARPDFKVQFQGAYGFQKPRTRRQVISIGKLLADDRVKDSLALLDSRSSRALGPNVNLNTAIAANRGAISTGAYAGVTILEVISDLTGLRGGFNKALVGDARGTCIPVPPGACDKWHVYDQGLLLKAVVTDSQGNISEASVVSVAEHERLLPIEMMAETQPKLLSLLLP